MKRIICITIRSELKKFFCSLFLKAHVYITISIIQSFVWCTEFSCGTKVAFLKKSLSFLLFLLSKELRSLQRFITLIALDASSQLC